MRHPYPKIY